MNPSTPASPPKYIAQITHAQEVTLRGAADLAFWKERLRGTGLTPASETGKAQVLISSVAARFLGIAFRELSLSVFVSREGGSSEDGVFLVHAFHSSRLFAFIERTLFGTPYFPAAVAVDAQLPVACQASRKGKVILRAEMSHASGQRPESRRGEEVWSIPIFLPGKPGTYGAAGVFFARLSGDTHVYPFLPADLVTLNPTPEEPAVQWLIDSQFVGVQWSIRPDATHARSKTVRRRPDEVFRQTGAT